MAMTINGIDFYYSECCGEYQYQATSAEEYEKVQIALINNGYDMEERYDFAYFSKVDAKQIYVERNY